ncbi:hypothetical protein [Methylacidimicrobium sp. B4]|uniref:hypothetical protein n=1 Tax=Methylacidimicrobium sp. B4 TaxID=2796139 RepID=UPI001A8EFD5C|nr:hypothetical protein [Methylacidimicrobium sp. B4]QSR84576.1 hypothetical protein MacB4_10325 [Methylacidimicrobium sp. B4]
MRILMLPILLAVGLPTCSSNWNGVVNAPRQQQGGQSAAPPAGTASGGLFGFIPGGCPPITEQTRVEVANLIYAALHEKGINTSPGADSSIVPNVLLTSLAVAPGRDCSIAATWTASFRFDRFTQSIPGATSLRQLPGGAVDMNYLAGLQAWAQIVDTDYWSRDLAQLNAERWAEIQSAMRRGHP